jgi:pimeloyl-ACP methyl ester carboxylesterase
VEPFEDPLEADPSLLSGLEVPAVVAVGELDLGDFHLGAAALAEELRLAGHVVIPGAGHLAPLEQPEAFLELLLDFLRETYETA